jgi:ribosomal silencing factor RsfS
MFRERKASFLQQARDEAQRLAEEKSALLTKQLGEEKRLADEELAEARAETDRRRREIEEAEAKAMHDALQIEDSMKRLQEEQLRAELEVSSAALLCTIVVETKLPVMLMLIMCTAQARRRVSATARRRKEQLARQEGARTAQDAGAAASQGVISNAIHRRLGDQNN